MPRAIVTQEAVFVVADQLVAAGQDATIIAVQAQIGGGSYTTIKRFLDQWRAEREAARQPTVDLPAELASRGSELVRALWLAATDLAEQRVTQIRAEAQRQVAVANAALAEAETVIAHQEEANADQAQTIEQLQQQVADLQATSQAAQAQIAALEQRLRTVSIAARNAPATCGNLIHRHAAT